VYEAEQMKCAMVGEAEQSKDNPKKDNSTHEKK
jgi:hypothetical protein